MLQLKSKKTKTQHLTASTTLFLQDLLELEKKKKQNQKAADATISSTFKTEFSYAHQDVLCKSGLGEKAGEVDTSNAFCGKR